MHACMSACMLVAGSCRSFALDDGEARRFGDATIPVAVQKKMGAAAPKRKIRSQNRYTQKRIYIIIWTHEHMDMDI